MQLYKVIVDMIVPEGVEIWSFLHPGLHEELDNQLAPKVINLTSEPLPNGYRFTSWFTDQQAYIDFQLFKETLVLYRDRTEYETSNGITRIVMSQEYVEV